MKIEKVIKKLPTGFADEAAGMDETALRAAIVDADASVRETEMARDSDETLAAVREQLKDLSSGYRDAIGAQRAKVAYCLHLLEERGKLGTEGVGKVKRRR